MHLIIDGYNLIRRSPWLSQLDAQDLECGREALLELLGAYRRRRPQHAVTVVFDGWGSGECQENRDLYRGVTVIFSRRGERADEVIKRLLTRERGRAVVVSSDRDLQAAADRVGAVWVTAAEFERRCRAADLEEEEPYPGEGKANKKGPARRPPKRQRQRQQRLRKL